MRNNLIELEPPVQDAEKFNLASGNGLAEFEKDSYNHNKNNVVYLDTKLANSKRKYLKDLESYIQCINKNYEYNSEVNLLINSIINRISYSHNKLDKIERDNELLSLRFNQLLDEMSQNKYLIESNGFSKGKNTIYTLFSILKTIKKELLKLLKKINSSSLFYNVKV